MHRKSMALFQLLLIGLFHQDGFCGIAFFYDICSLVEGLVDSDAAESIIRRRRSSLLVFSQPYSIGAAIHDFLHFISIQRIVEYAYVFDVCLQEWVIAVLSFSDKIQDGMDVGRHNSDSIRISGFLTVNIYNSAVAADGKSHMFPQKR